MTVMKSRRTPGKWMAQVSYTDPETGRRRYLSRTADTRGEAKALERQLKAELAAEDTGSSDDGYTLGDIYGIFGPSLWVGMKDQKNPQARLKTAVELIGLDTPVEDLSTSSLDKLVKKLRQRGTAGPTINRYLNSLNTLLKTAHKRKDPSGRRYLPQLPEETPWQRENTPRSRFLSSTERKELLEALRSYPVSTALGEAVAAFCIIAMKTGARRSEIINVNPETDLQAPDPGTGWGQVVFRDTKNGEAGFVPIDEECYELLRRYAPFSKQTTGYLQFEHRLYDVWKHAKKAMGLEDDEQFTPHVLRHTHATLMVEQGVPLPVIQKQLRHKQIQTTARYAHVTDKVRLEAAKKTVKSLFDD